MKRLGLVLVIALVATLVLAFPVLAGEPDPGSGAVNFTVQNLGSITANVTAQYVDGDGSVDYTKADVKIGPLASEGFPASAAVLDDGWDGSVVVSADQEIVAFGQAIWTNSSLDGGAGRYQTAGAYNGFTAGATTLYLPSLAARAGKQFSKISVQSAAQPSETETVTFDITFYDRQGNESLQLTDVEIYEGAQVTFDLTQGGADLTAGGTEEWLGAAVIESADEVAAVATTHWTNYSAAYSAVSGGGPTAYLPSATRRIPSATGAGGPTDPGWLQYTGVVVQNLSPTTEATVTVRWYDREGNLLEEFDDPIPANSAHGYNTRYIDTSDVPDAYTQTLATELTKDWNGSVVIESDGPDIVAVANLQWTPDHPSSPNSASAYTSFDSGTANVYAPATFRRGVTNTVAGISTQFTGLIVQNVGGSTCSNFDVDWYPRGSTSAALSYQDTLDPNIAHGYNTKQGSGGSDFPTTADVNDLGYEFRGSVVIDAPGCELVAIHNTVWPVWTDSTTYNAFGK
jgi:hypothetical protein